MKRLPVWTRDLHLYLGLVLSPFILLFAISTVLLNHRWQRTPTLPAAAKQTTSIDVADGAGTLAHARQLLDQLHVTGEIDYVRHNAKAERLLIPVSQPGLTTRVEVDLRARTATVEREAQGLGGALIYLHRMPGPHNVAIRGNWIYLRWWSVVTDSVVYGVLLLTASGLYLWGILKAERGIGWLMLVAGTATVGAMITAICAS
ncbi:MAG: hypothetical protein Q7S40_29630 [Opitutaceae bacterium]|nr:hypothetical protein [Opitutaceae bacterium]